MSKPHYIPKDKVPMPPKDADVLTTVCDYCIVGCGYKVYRWPVGKEGGTKASENALAADFPVNLLSGTWISPTQHNVVSVNGKPHNVAIIADKDIKAVNLGGDHSIRGGTIAQKCYNPDTPTKDRLKYPMLRVNGKLTRISWDDAMDIMSEVSKHVIDKYGEDAWAMKMYSYQYWENTHALTKLALRSIETAAFAVHDQPTGHGPDTPGMADAGIDNFSASYEDWSLADVLFISGTDPFESKTIIYNEWILKGIHGHGMKVISVLPKKTQGVAYNEKMGGLYLEINPGTDTILQHALARIIVENGWEDKEFLERWINNRTESDREVFQADGFEDYKEWILGYKYAELDRAVEITGIPAEKIKLAAEYMAKPKADGTRPKTSIGFEKGNYWSNNYLNTASLTALGLIVGAGNRPGQIISRFGGHQRGIENGDRVKVWSDQVPIHVGGYGKSEVERKARGVVPLTAQADLENPDDLLQTVDTEKKNAVSGYNADLGSTFQEEPDFLLDAVRSNSEEPGNVKKVKATENSDLENDDPLLEYATTAIGMKWEDIKPMTFSALQKGGFIEYDRGEFEAVAIVTSDVKKGVAFSYFNLPGGKGETNSLAGRVLDPISQRPRFKLSRGKVDKIGESKYKKSFAEMSFKSRAIV